MKVVSYQTGVDVLGFPIYVEHKIYDFKPDSNSKFHKSRTTPLTQVVEQKIIKQH